MSGNSVDPDRTQLSALFAEVSLSEYLRLNTVVSFSGKFTFSDVHGPKLEISQNGTYARRYEGYCWSIALSSQRLNVGENLEFAIEETEPGWGANMNVGIIYTPPENLSPGALVTCDANASASLPTSRVFIFEKETYYIPVGDPFTFTINKEGEALLSPNVTYDDVVFTEVDVKRPFWALFNVFGNTKAISLRN